MLSKRKILTILSVVALIFLGIIGLHQRERQSQEVMSAFSEMFSLTDKALIEFSEIDEKWLKGQETDENYKKAWYDLNYKLEQIKRQDDRPLKLPKEIEEVVTTYRAGFYRVLSVSNDVVDYLNEETKDPMIIIKNREEFEEGLELLRKVKDKLKPSEKVV